MCSHTVTLTCSPMEFINIVSHTFCSISGLPEASEHLTERKREAKAFLLDCLSTTYLLSDCQCFFSRISLPLVPSAPLLSAIHPAMDKRWPDVLSITGIFVLKWSWKLKKKLSQKYMMFYRDLVFSFYRWRNPWPVKFWDWSKLKSKPTQEHVISLLSADFSTSYEGQTIFKFSYKILQTSQEYPLVASIIQVRYKVFPTFSAKPS